MAALQPTATTSSRWTSGLAFVVLVLLAVLEVAKLTAFHLAGPAPVVADAAGYWSLGQQVAAGDMWMLERPIGSRTPGYPWFLGAVQRLFGSEAWRVASIVQHAAVGVATALTVWWVWHLTGSLWLANAALILRCISLAAPSFAGTMLTEAIYEPVFLALLIGLTWRPRAAPWLRWATLGFLFAAGFLIRPAHTAVVPVFVLAAILECWSLPAWQARLQAIGWRLLVAGCVAFVLIAPWCIRNARVFGRAAPVIFVGRELWMSVFGPGRPQGPDLPRTPEAAHVRQALQSHPHADDWRVNWSTSRALMHAGLNDAEADELMKVVAVQAFWQHPVRVGVRVVWRQIDFWRTVYSRELYLYGDALNEESTALGQTVWGTPERRQQRAALLDIAPERWLLVIELGSLMGLVGALGLCLVPRHGTEGVVILATLLSMDLLSGALDIPNYRLRMVLEPLLIVGGIAGWTCWLTLIRAGLRAVWRATPATTQTPPGGFEHG